MNFPVKYHHISLLFLVLPIIIACIFRILWISFGGMSVTLLTAVLNVFINPIYLNIISKHLTSRYNITLKILFPVSLLSVIISIIIQYFNWKSTTKYIDSITVLIVWIELAMAVVILVIGLISIYIQLKR